MLNRFFIVIAGPTGVGKTDFADLLSKRLNFKTEILNADLGQFYTPLNIGTAKPDLLNCTNYSLFNILDRPENFTVYQFRNLLINKFQNLWQKNIVPLVVGGSAFYIQSIFFPTESLGKDLYDQNTDFSSFSTLELYNRLIVIDSVRANEIDANDRYRIERALSIWYSSCKRPSQLVPKFSMPLNSKAIFYYLIRDRQELYSIINKRTQKMFDMGLFDEVMNLDRSWKNFLARKKIIGYNEIITYLEDYTNNVNLLDLENLIDQISKRTRNYAKRQLTFWSKLKNMLISSDKDKVFIKDIKEINLTELDIDLCLSQLSLNLEQIILNNDVKNRYKI